MENTISWTIPNLVTVTLMVMVTFAVVAFLTGVARAVGGKKATASADAASA